MTNTFALRLVLDARQLKQGILVVKGQFTQLKRSANSANKALKQVQKRMNLTRGVASRLREQMITLGVAFIGLRAISGVVSILRDFDQEMQTVLGVTGATADQFAALTKTARELGATTRFTATQAAEGLTLLSRAGFTAVEAMDAVGASLNLAVGGALTMARATEVTATAVRQFGLEASEATRVTDVFITTTNRANTNVNALGQSMKFVGPVAGALGISIEEAAAAVGTLGDAGIQGSLAGTQLRGVFAGLSSVTERAKSALKDMGLALEDINPAGGSLIDIFERLNKAGLNAERAFAIFGRRQATGALILSRNIDKFRELTEENNNSADAAQRMADIMDDSLNGAMLQLKSAAQELVLAMGESGLGDALRGTVELMTFTTRAMAGLETGAGSLEPVVQSLATVIKAFSAALVTLIGIKVIGFLASAAKGMLNFSKATATGRGTLSIFTAIAVAAFIALDTYNTKVRNATFEQRELTRSTKALNDALITDNLELQSVALKNQVENLDAAIKKTLDLQSAGLGLGAVTEGLKEVFGGGVINTLNDELGDTRDKMIAVTVALIKQRAAADAALLAVERSLRELFQAGIDTQALISQFGVDLVDSLLPAGTIDKANKKFLDRVQRVFTIESSASDAFVNTQFGPVRDAISNALSGVSEDAQQSIEPTGLRRIREQVEREVKNITIAIQAEATPIAQAIAGLSRQIDTAEGVDLEKLFEEQGALRERLRALLNVGDALEDLTRRQLIFQAQERASENAVERANKGFRDQQLALVLNEEALEDYNLEQRIFKELQNVGAENTDLFGEALAGARKELENLRRLEREDATIDAVVAIMQQTAAFNEQRKTIGLTGDALEKRNAIRAAELELEKAGILNSVEGKKKIEDLKKAFDQLSAARSLKAIFDEVGAALGSAFTDFIIGAKSASAALEDFLRSASKALVQKAVASLIGGAIGGIQFEKGGVFSSGGQLTPFASGGVINSPTIFPFANGIGLAGESGPEAIVPLKRGSDGTLGIASTGGGQPITVNMTINTPDADGIRRSQRQITSTVRKAVGQARGNAGR